MNYGINRIFNLKNISSAISFTCSGITVSSREEHHKFKCNLCGYSTNIATNFRTHQLRHSGEKPFKCIYCSHGFTTKQNLLRHIYLHESGIFNGFTCNMCEKWFSSQVTFSKHRMWHHKGKSTFYKYNCTQCPYSTNTSTNFKKHGAVHRNYHPYECHVCGNRFASVNSLKVHEIIHTGENMLSIPIMVQNQCQFKNLKNIL
ncbi:zinc finger protein 136-like [Stegodyphus dumicola]|uniref:zinc finger protein 136-like n=1 Tax=Stegodyphus dumicola TaxID=202533 RepID=UPI0015AD660F|nr:zinc finger protein 136-like [Stegodyphus dumicola]